MFVLAPAAVAPSPQAAADDGNLTQQVQIEQSKSAFQLKLEQIEAGARQRAAASRAAAPQPAAVDLGGSDESMRLEPVDPVGPDLGPDLGMDTQESALRLQAEQAYERDQQFILEQRQQREALRLDSPVLRSSPAGGYARERSDRVRIQSQNKQQAVQRKLRP